VISLGLALLLQGAAPPATADTDRARQPPVFEAGVALVAVPVFVTDKDGKAVAGLQARDFEVFDGKQRVEIAAFQAVDVDALREPDARLPVAVQAVMARQFVLLFDLQFSDAFGLFRTRKAAARFVRESLAPTDLVAVAVFGFEGLKFLTNFGTEREPIARAIDSLGMVQAVANAQSTTGGGGAVSGSGGRMAGLADSELSAQARLMGASIGGNYSMQVFDFFSSLRELAQTLSPLRGRKQVVLFTGGFSTGWPREAEDTLRAVRESDIVIHTVSTHGIRGPVDVASPTGLDETPGDHPGGFRGLSYRREARAALAGETGGRDIMPTNNFGVALREVDQVSRHYYVLAFNPADPSARPGRPRELRVSVQGRGLTVSHRSAYVVTPPSSVPDAQARLSPAEALAKGLSSDGAGLHLVALPYRAPGGAPSIPAVFHIEPRALPAVGDTGSLRLEVHGYAVADGRVLDSLHFETRADLAKLGASLRRDGLRVVTTFVAAPGPVDVRFAVRAGDTGEIASIRRRVEVPSFGAGDSVLSAPLLTLPLQGRVAFPMRTVNGAALEVPFQLGADRFVADDGPLRSGQARDVCMFVWPASPGPALEVTAEMDGGEGPALPVRLEGAPRVVRDADGFDRYVVTLVPPPAPPGSYRLRLTLRDAATGRLARSEGEVALIE
jgi:VWFA-related protein